MGCGREGWKESGHKVLGRLLHSPERNHPLPTHHILTLTPAAGVGRDVGQAADMSERTNNASFVQVSNGYNTLLTAQDAHYMFYYKLKLPLK